ncbi:MAG: DJ-1/PfpI family protein [Pseudomonadota bacterium]
MTTFAILAYDGIEPIDIGATFGVLSMARRVAQSLSFFVVAPEKGAVVMANDLVLQAPFGVAEAPTADVTMVLGGPGWEAASRDPRILDHLQAIAPDQVLASVCTGGMILAAAGLLAGHRATTKDQILPGETRPLDLLGQNPGVDATSARIVDEGRIVTGGGVSLGIDMTLYLLGRFEGQTVRDETARVLEYGHSYRVNAERLGDLIAK